MKTITNTSLVADYTGEQPVVTPSNPVSTLVRIPDPTPMWCCRCCDCCDGCGRCRRYCRCYRCCRCVCRNDCTDED